MYLLFMKINWEKAARLYCGLCISCYENIFVLWKYGLITLSERFGKNQDNNTNAVQISYENIILSKNISLYILKLLKVLQTILLKAKLEK